MGVLSIFKTKKIKAMDLPPPPIQVDEDRTMPELPDIEAPPAPLPELPGEEPSREVPIESTKEPPLEYIHEEPSPFEELPKEEPVQVLQKIVKRSSN